MLPTISRTHINKVIKRGNKTTFILFFLQSIRVLQNGATVATYDYDPWGNLLSAEPTDSRIKGQPIRYAGYVYDAETKLYYLQARYYDPATARFIFCDPASDVAQYIRKAVAFSQNLRGAKKSKVSGKVSGVIRYKKNGKYIDLAPDGSVFSFGKQ
ncbi:RHS repeat-associated core domain-containing protein [Lysinibacillus sp. Ag94]|uniref:RHS repeat-associated core domain-containing protein n=1 Tax=Lysinibacillus sp. Ag94 TaxID=2936682 RepID=UPI00200FED05|nr:RHS repeat-associated core domain-containing protein [Lysinibacillus sp. Ag94]UPW84282.1 RHS repeat-associated core domain-containing protein [Lysinibacillus sp. Ag94]